MGKTTLIRRIAGAVREDARFQALHVLTGGNPRTTYTPSPASWPATDEGLGVHIPGAGILPPQRNERA